MKTLIMIGVILAVPCVCDSKIIKRLDITSSPLKKTFIFERGIHQKEELATKKLNHNHSSKKLEHKLLEVLQIISQENLIARNESCTAESLEKILKCLAKSYPSVFGAKSTKDAKFKRAIKRDDYDDDMEDWVDKLEVIEAQETTPDAVIDTPAHATCLVESIADYMLCAIAEASEASTEHPRSLHTEKENEADNLEYFMVSNKLNEQF